VDMLLFQSHAEYQVRGVLFFSSSGDLGSFVGVGYEFPHIIGRLGYGGKEPCGG